jgi:NADPH-dependent curcumin reductase CurA
MRVIGTAGGAEKCAYVSTTLGFDACLDHRLPDLTGRIAEAAPDGIQILFENVGGPNLDATLPSMTQGGRIMLCGLAAHYNDALPLALRNFKALLYRGLTLRGFITAEHPHLFAAARAELRDGVASGSIAHRESITDGLEHAPAAYLEMLTGRGIGKRLIRLP